MQPPTCCGGAAGRPASCRVRAQDRRAFGGAQHRLVLGSARTASRPRRGAAGDRRFGRRRLAVGADHVRLPVVEVQLRGLADLLFGARGVASRRAAPRRFRSPPERWISGCATPSWSTRLRMMSIARFERFGVDFRLRRRLALVDELDAALEVEPEARRLRRDHDAATPASRPTTISRTKVVAAAVGHRLSRLLARASARAAARRRRRRPGTCRPWRWRRRRVRPRPRPAPRARARPTRAPCPTGSSPFAKLRPSTSSTRWPITSSSSRPVNANEFLPQPITRPSPSQTKKAASGAG